jgi:hypothetical protein
VPDIYTTGDNDPELEPTSYFRHYMYCDACGAFELEPWTEPQIGSESHQALERRRQRLGLAAQLAAVLVLVPAWLALHFVFSPTLVMFVICATSWAFFVILRFWRRKAPAQTAWRWFKATLPWFAATAVAEFLSSSNLYSPLWVVAVGGVALVVLLTWRSRLGEAEHLGRRCAACGATYAHRSAFFSDLDANPRQLEVGDVPRPLGSSYFVVGKSVPVPASATESRNRLP